ncbi:hypothetical protein [Dictyobacter arantiisoli]|uniref:Zinc-finger domain-containing protein n=1 Tax=Dictyobacter arantiisoli TaxID=2014874 RepID=A0A5A5TK93_9CHLR|nr:hypothetical protein [Dictyobacter arantiisoli]GCF11443.1 hypothetical protein KDI_50070 [Dictyobacter arantiisoli]
MMDCLCLVAPNDEELLRYVLDGEALPVQAGEHIARCLICQHRLASYTNMNTLLLGNIYRYQCPDSTTLSQYCVDILPIDDEITIRCHLEHCPLCAREVADARHFLADEPLDRDTALLASMKAPLSVSPSLSQADMITLSLQAGYESEQQIWLCGVLSQRNDLQACTSLVGISAEIYRATWSSEPLENPEHRSVAGEYSLAYDEAPLLSTRVDETGKLFFHAMHPGHYLLIIHLPETTLVIENLHIKQDETM